jgi:hypothetical protein
VIELATASLGGHQVAGRDEGFYVQVGSFSDPSNAGRAEANVAAVGPVETTPVDMERGRFYRVRVGPSRRPGQRPRRACPGAGRRTLRRQSGAGAEVLMAPCAGRGAGTQNGPPFESRAKQAILMDSGSGKVLFEKNADELMHPASMSKIMTMIMVFERLKSGRLSLDDEFSVSENAWRRGGATSGGSTMYAELNSRVRLEDLIKGVIVQSGNDACIVIAEGIAGSEAGLRRHDDPAGARARPRADRRSGTPPA